MSIYQAQVIEGLICRFFLAAFLQNLLIFLDRLRKILIGYDLTGFGNGCRFFLFFRGFFFL